MRFRRKNKAKREWERQVTQARRQTKQQLNLMASSRYSASQLSIGIDTRDEVAYAQSYGDPYYDYDEDPASYRTNDTFTDDGTNTFDGTYASDVRGNAWSQVNDTFTQATPGYDDQSYNQWTNGEDYYEKRPNRPGNQEMESYMSQSYTQDSYGRNDMRRNSNYSQDKHNRYDSNSYGKPDVMDNTYDSAYREEQPTIRKLSHSKERIERQFKVGNSAMKGHDQLPKKEEVKNYKNRNPKVVEDEESYTSVDQDGMATKEVSSIKDTGATDEKMKEIDEKIKVLDDINVHLNEDVVSPNPIFGCMPCLVCANTSATHEITNKAKPKEGKNDVIPNNMVENQNGKRDVVRRNNHSIDSNDNDELGNSYDSYGRNVDGRNRNNKKETNFDRRDDAVSGSLNDTYGQSSRDDDTYNRSGTFDNHQNVQNSFSRHEIDSRASEFSRILTMASRGTEYSNIVSQARQQSFGQTTVAEDFSMIQSAYDRKVADPSMNTKQTELSAIKSQANPNERPPSPGATTIATDFTNIKSGPNSYAGHRSRGASVSSEFSYHKRGHDRWDKSYSREDNTYNGTYDDTYEDTYDNTYGQSVGDDSNIDRYGKRIHKNVSKLTDNFGDVSMVSSYQAGWRGKVNGTFSYAGDTYASRTRNQDADTFTQGTYDQGGRYEDDPYYQMSEEDDFSTYASQETRATDNLPLKTPKRKFFRKKKIFK